MGIDTLVAQILFFAALVIVGLVANRITRIDRALCCVVAGFIGGQLLPWLEFDTGIRAHTIKDLVFYIILPILIFDAAWKIKPKMLKYWLRPVLTLATFGVPMAAMIVGGITFFGMAHPSGFPFEAALLLGAMVAATDPTTVMNLLRQRQADENLATLMEGESLFNDATAIILFTVVLALATGNGTNGDIHPLLSFAVTFAGAVVLGWLLGLATATVVLFLNDQSLAVICLLALAFTSFFVAENILHVSGIVAIVTAAITSRLLLHEHEDTLLSNIEVTWDWLGSFLTLLIFVLMGLATELSMFTDQWLAMLIAIVAALLARFISVYSLAWPFRKGSREISAGWQLILGWGGLRGVIAIVLVLSLPVDLPYWWTLQAMVFGVVYFSLLAQGLTIGRLIDRYAVTKR